MRKPDKPLEPIGITTVHMALDNRDSFDYIMKAGMSSGNTLDIATVDDKICKNGPVLALGFVSMNGAGMEERSQFTMHVAQFLEIADALKGAHPELFMRNDDLHWPEGTTLDEKITFCCQAIRRSADRLKKIVELKAPPAVLQGEIMILQKQTRAILEVLEEADV